MSYVFVPWSRQPSEKVMRVSLPSSALQKSVRQQVAELEKRVLELEIKLKEK